MCNNDFLEAIQPVPNWTAQGRLSLEGFLLSNKYFSLQH
jgi:hypothetical protein